MNQKIKKTIRYFVPVWLKKTLKYLLYSFQDMIEVVTGKRDNKYPPKRLNFVGSSEFKKIGNEFFVYFKDICSLKETENVLDIGCGIGRMAIPMTEYIKGEYCGFDIDKRGVDWCVKNISTKFQNFHFAYVDLFNKYYNKGGKLSSATFNFPYEDNRFDFSFATSVFTHMLPIDTENYLKELSRVLRSGGSAFLTFFVLNENSKKLMKEGKSNCDFIFSDDDISFYSHKDMREAEIAYEEEWIKKAFEKYGLSIEKFYNGSWSGTNDYLTYQDVFVVRKK